jgi:hypothetical protein
MARRRANRSGGYLTFERGGTMIKRNILMTIIWMAILFFSSAPILAEMIVDTAWVRRYNGPGNSIDGARDIAVDCLGNVYVTGETYDTLTSYDYATIKYYPNGDTAWARAYNGPANASDAATAMEVDDSGNVYVTGRSSGVGTGFDFTTIKYDTHGNQLWIRRYNGPGSAEDWPLAIAVDDSGNVYAAGRSYDSLTLDDFTTIKYSSDGDTVWVRRYNGPSQDADDIATSVCVDDWGNVYVAGYSSGSSSSSDFATIKYYSNGDTAWVRRYDGPGNSHDGVYAMAVDDLGNVYVTGTSRGIGTESDYATIKYHSNGDTAWVRRYNEPGEGTEYGRAIAVDDSGNVCVTGHSSYGGYCTIKYDSNGNQLWVRYYGGFSRNDAAMDIAVDDAGSIYVTGYSTGAGTNYDYATIKYYPDGETAWIARYYGQAGYSKDQAYAIAFDSHRNVCVTGLSNSSETWFDYATIKYVDTGRLRGDANADGAIDASDIVYLLNYLYRGDLPPDPYEAGDCNCDGGVTAGDIVYLINYLFRAWPPPSCP